MGSAVKLSGVGLTLAIGARTENGAATGINGDQSISGVSNSGAAYVLAYRDARWQREAYIKPRTNRSGDRFGTLLSISADGNTLAVSAPGDLTASTGINGNPDPRDDNWAFSTGAVYMFTRRDGFWFQRAYIKPSNTDEYDYFARFSISLSADGQTLAAGSTQEDSAATGINGDQSDNSQADSGAVYLY